ncbi:HAD family hydrolase [Hydrogenophaga sp. 5NK40-0174]|uniref:HAD family hydrolase n=1 Tax=Hydrogenophaga sp. 5NK40-0174 TaxID=3127649 RepID=UPI0033410A20
MTPTEIAPQELAGLLETLPSGVKALSLDCFDTIVWRRVERPSDVFFNLQAHPRWQEAGMTAALRAKAENRVREEKHLLHGIREVNLLEVYQRLLPDADETEINAWCDVELEEEVASSFAFQPVLELMRAARRKGLRVLVVSDTYFSQPQLKSQLKHILGEQDAALISEVYCSADHGVGKTSGIWRKVLKAEKLQPGQVVHIGDNLKADAVSPSQFGIAAHRLKRLPDSIEGQLEQRAHAGAQLLPEVRHEVGLPSSSHGVLAAHFEQGHASVPYRIGYTALGPIFHDFSQYVQEQLATVSTNGRPAKMAFMLRDGYLPALAYAACHNLAEPPPMLNISRFTANAASLRSKEDVVRLVTSMLSEKSMDAVLKQCLFTPQEIEVMLGQVKGQSHPAMALGRMVLRDDKLRCIQTRSASLRERLYEHVRARTHIEPGDTLVIVDLGYGGTTQTRLREAFAEELGVTLHGLYLIASRTEARQKDRTGLVGPDWADERLVHTLTAYIGLFEMMCTKAEPPTIGYDERGNPAFGTATTKGQQSATVQEIQTACVQYVRDAVATPPACRPRMSREQRGWQVAAELGRLIYLPSQEEVACLSAFEFDFNLGTDLVLDTANLEQGLAEYRREGFGLLNRDFTSMRVSYPMELRNMDVSLSTTLMSLQRFGYGLRPSDASYRKESVPMLVANQNSHAKQVTEAVATHDGYYTLHLPMSSTFDASVLLGQRYEWVQLDAIQKVDVHDTRKFEPLVIGENVFFDGIEQAEGNLVKLSQNGMMFLPACSRQDQEHYMMRVVYRPVREREAVQ